jgi:hypothetical protein
MFIPIILRIKDYEDLKRSGHGALTSEGILPEAETLSFMSPYLTEHINRFGDYRLSGDRQLPPPDFRPAWLEKAGATRAVLTQ